MRRRPLHILTLTLLAFAIGGCSDLNAKLKGGEQKKEDLQAGDTRAKTGDALVQDSADTQPIAISFACEPRSDAQIRCLRSDGNAAVNFDGVALVASDSTRLLPTWKNLTEAPTGVLIEVAYADWLKIAKLEVRYMQGDTIFQVDVPIDMSAFDPAMFSDEQGDGDDATDDDNTVDIGPDFPFSQGANAGSALQRVRLDRCNKAGYFYDRFGLGPGECTILRLARMHCRNNTVRELAEQAGPEAVAALDEALAPESAGDAEADGEGDDAAGEEDSEENPENDSETTYVIDQCLLCSDGVNDERCRRVDGTLVEEGIAVSIISEVLGPGELTERLITIDALPAIDP